MRALEKPIPETGDLSDVSYARAAIQLIAIEYGEQITCMDSTTAFGMSVAHKQASISKPLSFEDCRRHALLGRMYDRLANAYLTVERHAAGKQR